jgi:hypothetical protein
MSTAFEMSSNRPVLADATLNIVGVVGDSRDKRERGGVITLGQIADVQVAASHQRKVDLPRGLGPARDRSGLCQVHQVHGRTLAASSPLPIPE